MAITRIQSRALIEQRKAAADPARQGQARMDHVRARFLDWALEDMGTKGLLPPDLKADFEAARRVITGAGERPAAPNLVPPGGLNLVPPGGLNLGPPGGGDD